MIIILSDLYRFPATAATPIRVWGGRLRGYGS